MDKLVLPGVIGWVLYKLGECNEQPPGVGTVDYQPLQQNSSDLFLDGLSVGRVRFGAHSRTDSDLRERGRGKRER